MTKMFDLQKFIHKYVIERPQSMFLADIESNEKTIEEKIRGKKVLVIGGAGSIGSSFIKSILLFEPAELVIVDINENELAELTRDLRSTRGIRVPEIYLTYPMDFASEVFAKMFRAKRGFDIVANFSAHKHVRSEKDIYSIEALIQNNVFNAKKILDLLAEFPPEEFFCVSTDKAANPANIMGASKRIMEDMIFSYSTFFPVTTARFANVAFSNGSLPAGFLKRIAKQQPISAPSDVRRYFVSPEESGQICMLSCVLGENREIFFPKLAKEQMITFDSIATNLLKAYGYEILKCSSDEEAIEKTKMLTNADNYSYPVYYELSDTSGEKQYEEFYTKEETIDLNKYKSLGVITNKQICDQNKIEKLINDLTSAFSSANVSKSDIVSIIGDYLPNFNYIETGKSLDGKM